MDKTKILTIITILMIIWVGGLVFSYGINTPTPTNPEIHDYFNKICNQPYQRTYGPHPETFWQCGGDCDDRARVFKEYLKENGATDIRLVWVWREENHTIQWSYGLHEILVWNNHAYNPTHNKKLSFYNLDIKSSKIIFKEKYGYNRWKYLDTNQTISF